VVEGGFEVPCNVVALAAFEALRQFDTENDSVTLQRVNFVNIIPEVTSTFLSTFQVELDKQQKSELCGISSDRPVQHLGPKFDRPANNEVHMVRAAAEVSHASTKEESVHVSVTVYYFTYVIP